MKQLRPNFLIVAPKDETPDTANPQQLARILANEGWVYCAELDRDGVEDDEHGVRFLRWQDSLVDHFGALEAVVVVDNRVLAETLSQRREDVPIIHWDRAGTASQVDAKNETSLALVESFNRASPVLPVIERLAFSHSATAA